MIYFLFSFSLADKSLDYSGLFFSTHAHEIPNEFSQCRYYVTMSTFSTPAVKLGTTVPPNTTMDLKLEEECVGMGI